MTNGITNHDAFKQATLRSERIRIICVLATLAILLLYILFRWCTVSDLSRYPSPAVAVGILLAMMLYESAALWCVHHAVQSDRPLPQRLWYINVLAETSFPTIWLAWSATGTLYVPFQVLSAPVVLTYYFFIILSVLTLSPKQSCYTGIVAAVEYLAAVIYTAQVNPDVEPLFPWAAYGTASFLLLLGGLIAAGVARQVREHVMATLAETRRAERLEREMNIARSIQQGLLPKEHPAVPGYSVAGWNKPADETGGDYYDWLTLPDGRVLIIIADVTGHGLGPALVVAVCRAYFRAMELHKNTLEEAIWRVNHLLTFDLPAGSFVTAAIGILDPESNELQLFSAGHGPLMYYEAQSSSVRTVKPNTLPLGMMDLDDDLHSARQLRFEKGDVLILVTDGFHEWANPQGQRYGEDRLQAFIHNHHKETPDELITGLYHDVLLFSEGTSQLDDLTALILKRDS